MINANQTVFHVLDLDRTLLDTSKLAHHLKDIIAQHDPRLAEAIGEQIQESAKHHASFFIFEYITEQIGQERLNEYISELSHAVPSSELLLTGAPERLAFAKSHPGWSAGILTYGSRRDQMIKLKLAGLQMERYFISDTPKKGPLIASWKRPDGKYKLPIEFGGHTVDILTLDDDKPVSFEGLPSDVLGQWIAKASVGGVTELKNFSHNIHVVGDLKESTAYLKVKLAIARG